MVTKSPGEITIVDCGPRDGLSFVSQPVSTTEKVRLINCLAEAGVPKIDCVAFTHPRLIPSSSYAEQVMRQLEKRQDVTYIWLTPSDVVCRRANMTKVDEIIALVA